MVTLLTTNDGLTAVTYCKISAVHKSVEPKDAFTFNETPSRMR